MRQRPSPYRTAPAAEEAPAEKPPLLRQWPASIGAAIAVVCTVAFGVNPIPVLVFFAATLVLDFKFSRPRVLREFEASQWLKEVQDTAFLVGGRYVITEELYQRRPHRRMKLSPLERRVGWRWTQVDGFGCGSCEHLQTSQMAPGSEPISVCRHPKRGSSKAIPESCEPDPDGLVPEDIVDDRLTEDYAESYVPSWCGKLAKPATPCLMCSGLGPTERDDLCDECAAWLDAQEAEARRDHP